jgi:hypothetical protein
VNPLVLLDENERQSGLASLATSNVFGTGVTAGSASVGLALGKIGVNAGLGGANALLSTLEGDGSGGGGGLSSSSDAYNFSPEEDNDTPKKIKKLFSFQYDPLVRGRSVTAMAWNAVNSDILAVSYGRLEFNLGVNSHKIGTKADEDLAGGLVLFWSLRNPEYPEKFLRTPHPVTSLDFSRLSPMLLAVGCYNGDVLVYDVKREGADWDKPKEASTSSGGGHVDPVW